MAIIGDETKATTVAKSTNDFILIIKKAVIITTPSPKIICQIQYSLFSLLLEFKILYTEAITLGCASKQVSVVLNMVVKAAMAITK